MVTTAVDALTPHPAIRPDADSVREARRELRHQETERMLQDTRGNPNNMPRHATPEDRIRATEGWLKTIADAGFRAETGRTRIFCQAKGKCLTAPPFPSHLFTMNTAKDNP